MTPSMAQKAVFYKFDYQMFLKFWILNVRFFIEIGFDSTRSGTLQVHKS